MKNEEGLQVTNDWALGRPLITDHDLYPHTQIPDSTATR